MMKSKNKLPMAHKLIGCTKPKRCWNQLELEGRGRLWGLTQSHTSDEAGSGDYLAHSGSHS